VFDHIDFTTKDCMLYFLSNYNNSLQVEL